MLLLGSEPLELAPVSGSLDAATAAENALFADSIPTAGGSSLFTGTNLLSSIHTTTTTGITTTATVTATHFTPAASADAVLRVAVGGGRARSSRGARAHGSL